MKLNSFGIWFKEFVVNVFVQAFHAATYVTVVTVGLTAYTNTGDWLFFIICVLFLFQGEKIIRAIFNAQSSAGTIGDMAAAGALAMGMLKNASKLFDSKGKSKGGDGGDDDGDDKDAKDSKAKANKEKANKALNSNTPTQGAEKNKAAAVAAAENGTDGAGNANGAGTGGGSSSGGGANGQQPADTENEVKLGREVPTSHQEVFRSVNSRIDKQAGGKKKHPALKLGADMAKDFAGFAVRNTAGIATSMVAGTFALAQHTDAKSTGEALATTVAAYGAAKKLGQKAVDSVVGGYGNIKERASANQIAEEYERGEHDDEFVITEADEQLRKQKLAAYRSIAAKVARERAKYGKAAAEKMFIREELDTTK